MILNSWMSHFCLLSVSSVRVFSGPMRTTFSPPDFSLLCWWKECFLMSSSCTDRAVIPISTVQLGGRFWWKFSAFFHFPVALAWHWLQQVGPGLSLNLAFVNMSICHRPQHEQLVSRSVKAGSLVVTIANSCLACLQRNENKIVLCLNKPIKSLLRISQLSQPVYMAISSYSRAVGVFLMTTSSWVWSPAWLDCIDIHRCPHRISFVPLKQLGIAFP